MLGYVEWCVVADVLEECSVSIFRVKQPKSLLRTVTTCVYQSALRNISEDLDPNQHRSPTLKSRKLDVSTAICY
jgi:hypothetical protein